MTKKERESRGTEEADLLADLRKLSITATHEFVSGLDRLKELRDECETDVNGEATEWKKRREQAQSLAYELARHEVRHAEKILALSHTHADLLFDRARRLVQQLKAKHGPQAQPRVVDLRARRGEAASAKLVMKNPFNTDVNARFDLLRPFRTQSGDDVQGLKVAFTCTPLDISAHCRAEVSIDIPKVSAPVGVYFAELKVFAVGEVEQCVVHRILRLHVDEAAKSET